MDRTHLISKQNLRGSVSGKAITAGMLHPSKINEIQ